MTDWEAVIGLEVHVQLQTASKIFAPSSAKYGADANLRACALSIALPGTLPVMNMEAARLAVRFGLAIGAQINRRSVFARKHYFYPDLPKGYQISQYEFPIVGAGQIEIAGDDGVKIIGVTRAHLEEDAGKSLHEDFDGLSGIDLNRAGTPLLEIVSEPDLRAPADAAEYVRTIHELVRYLEISDGNMQEGSLRCDANISLRPRGQKEFGTRAEIKNLNSFRFIEKAIQYEIARQRDLLEDGGEVVQETRLYDADRDCTRPMRSKEDAHDYRYFPDPDLPAMLLDDAFINAARDALPELPAARRQRFMRDFDLPARDAGKIAGDRDSAEYFEAAIAAGADAKTAANWMLGELSAALNKHDLRIAQSPLGSAQLAELLARVKDRSVTKTAAKEIFHALWRGEGGVDEIIAARGLQQITDSSKLESMVARIIEEHPEQVAQYRAGKQKVFGFFVGQAMKASGGKADPAQVNTILRRAIDNTD